jgi:type II secretory pathway pseudopilin PulG
MRSIHTLLIVSGIGLLAACSEEQPPRSVDQFMANPIMLEAAIVRCSENRDATRYDPECVAARQASQLIEARDEAARRAEQEARSEVKRQAFRRTQEAAEQARRRAAEAERLRKEAEYLAQFGVAPPAEDQSKSSDPLTGNTPVAVIPNSTEQPEATSRRGDTVRATDGGNAPSSESSPESEEPATDLESIRNELQRRKDEGTE